MARIDCPVPGFEGAWIEIPDTFLGVHAQRRDQAVKAAEKYESDTLSLFAAAIAMLDEWNVPGLNGNPANWDLTKIDLRLIAWISNAAFTPFLRCFEVPKNS